MQPCQIVRRPQEYSITSAPDLSKSSPTIGSSAIETQSLTRKVTVGAAWLVAWRMLTRGLGTASTLIMARILVPADFGVLAMATTFAYAIDALSHFGVQDALVRRHESDERQHDTAFTLQLMRTALSGVIIAASAPIASRWFEQPRLLPILLVLAVVAAMTGLQNIGVVAFRRDLDYRRQFVFLCVPRLMQVAVAIALGVVLRNYWALVIAIVAAKVLQVVMSYVVHPYRPRLSLAHWGELAAFSVWTWAASIASIVWDRCDPFVLGPAIGATQLAVFLVGSEIAVLPVTELVIPAADVLFSGFSQAQRSGHDAARNALAVATTLLCATLPLCIAISGTAGYIIEILLGDHWSAATPLVSVGTWIGLFSPYSFVCGAALISSGHVRDNFIANCLASSVKLAGLIVAVTLTSDMTILTAVTVIIVSLEATIFVGFLLRAGGAIERETIFSVLRLLTSGALTLAAMAASGLFWQPVSLDAGSALVYGVPRGVGILLVFTIVTYAIWRATGRPAGAERRAADLLIGFVRPWLRRLTGIGGVATLRATK
jgi:lipopolysaccharide exporter